MRSLLVRVNISQARSETPGGFVDSSYSSDDVESAVVVESPVASDSPDVVVDVSPDVAESPDVVVCSSLVEDCSSFDASVVDVSVSVEPVVDS